MTLINVDYVAIYFKFLESNKIHSVPAYDTLQLIKYKMNTNLSSVTSNLREGEHSHLGLVLINGEYANVIAMLYV